MKAFLLNLPEHTERLKNFKANYPSCLPAFETLEMKTEDEVTPPDWWCSPGRFWSHAVNYMNALETCANLKEESILFEDDCIFRPDFNEKYTAFMAEVPSDWECIYLGAGHLQQALYPARQVSENVIRPRFTHATHAVIMRPETAARLLNHLKKEPWGTRHSTDVWLGTLFINPDVFKYYAPLVSLCGQGAFPSSLSLKDCQDRWFMNYRYIDLDGKMQTARDPYVSEE